MDLLSIQHLSVGFRHEGNELRAVDDISFTIRRGEILAMVGESGSGKSVTALSLLKLIPGATIMAGEMKISTGRGEVDLFQCTDEEMTGIRGRSVSMIFQEPMTSLNPAFTCGMQVVEVLKQHLGMRSREARAETIRLFGEVRLPRPEEIFRAYPHQISGGQKQRVMIAMAIACHPDLLIADEPTTALDVSVQRTILDLIASLQRSRGLSVLFITHDLGIAQGFADRVVVMYKGKIVEEGACAQVFKTPRHPYTRGLLACRPDPATRPERLPTVEDFLSSANNPSASPAVPERTGTKDRKQVHLRMYEQKPVVVVEGLSKIYEGTGGPFSRKGKEHRALYDIFMQVFPGETLGIVGESGCGKTTLARVLLRLIPESAGKIWYKEHDITVLTGRHLKQLRREIQIVFQDPYSSLNPRHTIGAAVTEPMKVHGLHGNRRRQHEKAVELLEQTGLRADHFYRYPHEFSGGQRQRICIARALAVEPELLILDEAVSALDVSVQAQVLNLLNDIRARFGLTYIFISHDLAVVKYMSDRVIVMKEGQIVESGEADELYARPVTEYTRMLLEASALTSLYGKESKKQPQQG